MASIGEQFGNYRLLRLLGEGGFAQVYLSEHIHLGTYAAIKILNAQLTNDDVNTFRREARTIARLIHPHIVRVLEFGIEGKTPFLVMDYAQNGSLRHRVPKGTQLAASVVVSYVNQVADALQYAHDRKVIHRDVKPDNMLIGLQNEVLLSDFGIALTIHSSQYPSTQQITGTVAYMSPEQILGKPTFASDQYSLGITVYEWLSGDRPFKGSFMEICTQHAIAQPPSLTKNVPTISPQVEIVVMKALAKDPKDRYPRIEDFAEDLEKASVPTQRVTQPVKPVSRNPVPPPAAPPVQPPPSVRSTPAQKPPQPVSTPLKKTPTVQQQSAKAPPSASAPQTVANMLTTVTTNPKISRRKLVATVAGTGVAIGAGAGGIYWLGSRNSTGQSSSTIGGTQAGTAAPTTNTTPNTPPPGSTLYTYRGHSEEFSVAWSPNGNYIASGGQDGTVQILSAASGTLKITHPYNGQSGGWMQVAWSPDSKFIASGGDDKTIQVWDAATGTLKIAYTGHGSTINSIAWSPNGNYIASGARNGPLQIWDPSTGNRILTVGQLNGVASVAWSPDSKSIATAAGTVQVWDASTGNLKSTYTGSSSAGSVAWSPDGKQIASGNGDNTAQVWDVVTGNRVIPYPYAGHSNAVLSVAWSPDSKSIASASADHTVQVWNPKPGPSMRILTYTGHTGWVYSVAWSPDGKFIASGSEDNTVKVWKAP